MLTDNKLNNHKTKIAAIAVFFVILAAFLVLFQSPALAQSDANGLLWGGTEGNVQNEIGLGNTDPRIVIARVIQIALGFLGIIAVLLIIYAGFLYMTSEGRADQTDQAKQILKNATIGLVIILASFGIASWIMSLLLSSTGGAGTSTGPNGRYNGGAFPGPDYRDRTLPTEGQPCLTDTVGGCWTGRCSSGLRCDSNDCTCKARLPGEGDAC